MNFGHTIIGADAPASAQVEPSVMTANGRRLTSLSTRFPEAVCFRSMNWVQMPSAHVLAPTNGNTQSNCAQK